MMLYDGASSERERKGVKPSYMPAWLFWVPRNADESVLLGFGFVKFLYPHRRHDANFCFVAGEWRKSTFGRRTVNSIVSLARRNSDPVSHTGRKLFSLSLLRYVACFFMARRCFFYSVVQYCVNTTMQLAHKIVVLCLFFSLTPLENYWSLFLWPQTRCCRVSDGRIRPKTPTVTTSNTRSRAAVKCVVLSPWSAVFRDVSGCFGGEQIVGLGFLVHTDVVCFLHKNPSQPSKKYLLWEKVAQVPLYSIFFLGWVGRRSGSPSVSLKYWYVFPSQHSLVNDEHPIVCFLCVSVRCVVTAELVSL